jgi:hypothetical protein
MGLIMPKFTTKDLDKEDRENTKRQDLLDFLASEHKRYNTEIQPLYPNENGDCDYTVFDESKTDFLEDLWDVISQHFDDENARQ